jgi:hypothetical protein
VNAAGIQSGSILDEPRLFDPARFAKVLQEVDGKSYDDTAAAASIDARFSISAIGQQWAEFISDFV